MSLIRLVMLEKKKARSGLIPSRSIPTVLLSISLGARNIETFWDKVKDHDPTLHEHYQADQDPSPLLEGIGDGLLVISWEHCCIESFQEFQPVTHAGAAVKHNGLYSLEDEIVDYRLSREWSIIDHYFEEKV